VEREKEKSNHQVAGRMIRWIRELGEAPKRPAVPHRRLRGNVVRPSPCRRRKELEWKEEGMSGEGMSGVNGMQATKLHPSPKIRRGAGTVGGDERRVGRRMGVVKAR
jgi:hypothetical protein